MRSRTALVVAVTLLCVAAMAVPAGASTRTASAVDAAAAPQSSSGAAPAADQSEQEFIQDCATEPPGDLADPNGGNEVIGWVDGYWYNEPLGINVTGGLSESELDKLAARTAARFEVMRCLPAVDGAPPVRIQSREAFQNRQSGLFADVSEKLRLADNAQFETLLIISSESNSTDVREENRGSTVGGQYNFRSDTITIVSDDPDSLLIDEEILVHEIGHAVQDQQFNLSAYERQTTDEDRGISALIEGDVSFIENRYLDACEQGLWDEPCVTEDFGGEGDGNSSSSQGPANWGLYFSQFQPYSDGPSFIQSVYQSGGWEAVNQLYEDPPRSAYYSAFPGADLDLDLANVTVPDRSTDEWERLAFEDSPDYDTVGVAGISGMFTAPTYESGGQFNIYNPQDILNTAPGGEVDSFNPLNYNQAETEGWRDDKLYTYRNSGNETGVVWRLAWSSEQAAQPFVESYQALVEYRGGQPVEGYESTYSFGEDSEFDMAVTIVQEGDRVTIVTAPTVEGIQEIHQGLELAETATETESSGDGETDEETETPEDPDGTESSGATDTATATETDGSDGAGFGILAGVLALLAAALLARRQQ